MIQIGTISTTYAVEIARKFFEQPESIDGSEHAAGFLFIYELFTRTVKSRLQGGSSHTLAVMLLSLFSDSRGGGLMGSILNILSNNENLCNDPALR